MENEKSIPLYAFNGRSMNLIDKFYIFGYNYLTLKKFLIDKEPEVSENNLNKDGLGSFKINEQPSIIGEITHDFNKQIISPELIKKLIFPNSLFINYRPDIGINKKFFNVDLEKVPFSKVDLSEYKYGCPPSFRSVFSSTPLEGKNSRKCQNGFAYTFYRRFLKNIIIKGKRYIFYIPFTFCIISEYPYYNSFESLFRNIRTMFSQQNIYIPIEILLYKIISLTPSPINTDIILDLSLMYNQYEIFSEKNENKSKNNKKIIKFNYLSGYPLIQYNLAKVLFHTLSIQDIIAVFLFTFLENSVIFFSKDIEYLTLTINAYGNFNFPLNDAEYFYNIGAISLDEFKNGDDFGIKNCSSIIAINNEYVENYLSKTNDPGDHVIVDLDKGNVMFQRGRRSIVDDDLFNEINHLIKNICKENNKYKYLKETKVYKAINNLYKRLIEIKVKKEKYFSNDKFKDYIQFSGFIGFNDDPYEGSIDELNKLIQQAFYECLITLSLYYYENFLIASEKNKSMEIKFNKVYIKNIDYKKEELLILNELKNTMKFIGSLSQFIMEHDPIDLYKIPLTFTDELLSVFSIKKYDPKAANIKYFDLIDKLYLTKKRSKSETIDFSSDINKYIANYKNLFDREIQENDKNIIKEDNSILIKILDYQCKKVLKYQTYELNDKILEKYIHIINNIEKQKYLESVSSLLLKEKNIITKIYITEIESCIEQYFIENKYLSNDELFSANLIILFILNLKYFPDNFDCNIYLSFLLKKFNPFRKFIYLIIQIIYEIYNQSLEDKNYKLTARMQLCFYECFNYIGIKNIVPNENLMFIINKFFYEDKEIKNNIEVKDYKEEKNKINEEINFNINEKNLIVEHNYTSDKKESETKDEDDFEIYEPKIRVIKKNGEYIESLLKSQNDIYNILSKEYNEYIKHLDRDKLIKKNILDSCLNLLIFIRDKKDLNQSNEIKHILENILYIYLFQ